MSSREDASLAPPSILAAATEPAVEDEPTDLLERISLFCLRKRTMPSHAHDALWIGRYCLLDKHSEGAMGVVCRAIDPQFPERPVALKIPKATHGPALRRRIRDEGAMLARVRHTHVLTVYEVGECEDTLFIATEFVAGPSLRAWQDAQPRPWRELLALYLQVGEGLAEIHRKGVVHQDIKPDNVAIDADGRARVLDFGLAHLETSLIGDATPGGIPSGHGTFYRGGTPGYMAPEQYLSTAVDARADQFGYCVCVWEAVYGGLPFTRDEIASTVLGRPRRPLGRPPLPTRGGPGWLRPILLRGLSERAEDRYPSMEALLGALRRRLHRRWWPIGSAVTAAAAAGAALAIAIMPAESGGQCEDPEAALAGVWDDERRATLDAAVVARPEVATRWPAVRGRLDEAARAWSGAYAQACSGGVLTGPLGAASQRCFMRERAVLERTVAAIAREPGRVAGALEVGADGELDGGLGRSADCGDELLLRSPAGSVEPRDLPVLAAIDEALAAGASALFLRDLAGAEEQLQRGLLLALRVADAGREAQARMDLGLLALLRGDAEAARVSVTGATGAAARAGDPVQSVRAWTRLLRVLLVLQRPAEALQLLPGAEGLATAQGQVPPLDTVHLLVTGAEAALRSEAMDEAEQLLRRAEAALAGVTGAEDGALAVFWGAHIDYLQHRAAEQRGGVVGCARLAHAERWLRGWFGADHPTRIPALRALGRCHLRGGAVEPAATALDQAAALARGLDPDDLEVGLVEYAQALLAADRGETAAAIRHGVEATRILERPQQDVQIADQVLLADLMGSLYLRSGDPAAAAAAYVRGLERARGGEPAAPDPSGRLLRMRIGLADAWLRQGQVPRAMREVRDALPKLLEVVLDADESMYIFGTAAMIALRCGDTGQSTVLAERALRSAPAGTHPGDLAEIRWILAQSLAPGDPRRAAMFTALESYYIESPGDRPVQHSPVVCPLLP